MKGTLFHVRRFQRVEAVPRWTMPDVLSNNNEDYALQVLNSILIYYQTYSLLVNAQLLPLVLDSQHKSTTLNKVVIK